MPRCDTSVEPEIVYPWRVSDGFYTDPRMAECGIPHAFTGLARGDMRDAENRLGAARAAGFVEAPLIHRQVHGTEILEAGGSPEQGVMEADGWIISPKSEAVRRLEAVAVFTADCPAIFLWSGLAGHPLAPMKPGRTGLPPRQCRAVGVFHAGWRGLAAGMPEKAVAAFARAGVPAGALWASVGPHARACCYEVGPELLPSFDERNFRSSGGSLTLDMGAEARLRLVNAGVAADRIGVSADCTVCTKDAFFSFRRDGRAGNQLALIGMPSALTET